ncbi:MAG TPA: class II aldolase/adducin family protein [Thermodesulfovibrionales bacterium]|nr:class II aldolase/adducin family protein [Thermodesulfovibrionales bacterium]
MDKLIKKYLDKLESQGLARKEDALLLALDAEVVSNRPLRDEVLNLSRIFEYMNINTFLFSKPAEPYNGIIDEMLRRHPSGGVPSRIKPMDCETRTFFHDIPVIDEYSPEAIAKALSQRKSAILRGRGIATYGVVSPEQAFVSFSSACFSLFVKFFYDSLIYLEHCAAKKRSPDKAFAESFEKIASAVRHATGEGPMTEGEESADRTSDLPVPCVPSLMQGPPRDEGDILRMLSEAGRALVDCRLVDSFFGNISYVHNDTIYISQTGSSLDELECCIDAVPLDGSSSVGITASSELSAHKNVYYGSGDNAILHGHPKFSVIMSMHCLKEGCDRDLCHRACREERDILGIPVVSGEIGRGPTGLMHTVPPAMKSGRGAIVYGHGVFASGMYDFRRPFRMLLDIERTCREEYFRLTEKYLVRR